MVFSKYLNVDLFQHSELPVEVTAQEEHQIQILVRLVGP